MPGVRYSNGRNYNWIEVDITSIKRTDEATAFWHPPSLIVDYDTLSEKDQDRLIEEAIIKAENDSR